MKGNGSFDVSDGENASNVVIFSPAPTSDGSTTLFQFGWKTVQPVKRSTFDRALSAQSSETQLEQQHQHVIFSS